MAESQGRPARRGYRSEVRSQQAARTREAITTAARTLFERHGFTGTTIAAIAAEAGVSQQTVYAAFGSKAALVRAILEQMEESADAAEWRERIAAEREPARILAAFAQWTRVFFEASRPVFEVVAQAASELPDFVAQGDEHRRRAVESIVARLAGAGALRAGVSEQEAADRIWLLTGIQPYLDATITCGWTPDAYAEWLTESLVHQVLAHRARGVALAGEGSA